MFVDFTHAGRDALADAIPHAPANIVPLLMAVRDHGLAFTMVAQSRQKFDLPEVGPAVVIIGDDMQRALGPPGFHVRSLRRLLGRAGIIAIMSGEPVVSFYARMAREAVIRRLIVVLVETQVSHELEWSVLMDEANPSVEGHFVSPTVATWEA